MKARQRNTQFVAASCFRNDNSFDLRDDGKSAGRRAVKMKSYECLPLRLIFECLFWSSNNVLEWFCLDVAVFFI